MREGVVGLQCERPLKQGHGNVRPFGHRLGNVRQRPQYEVIGVKTFWSFATETAPLLGTWRHPIAQKARKQASFEACISLPQRDQRGWQTP